MTNYKIDSRWCRVLLAMMLAILVAASSGMGQQRKAQPPKSARLYVFDCGSLNIPDTSPYQLKKEELATNYMSVPCFLVAHPKGTMIWDAGAVPDSAFKPGGASATLRDFRAASDGPIGRDRLRSHRYHVSRVLALSLGPYRKCQRLCERHVAGAKTRTRHHVRRRSLTPHGAGELQRAQE